MTKVLKRTEFEEIRAESLQVEEYHENTDGFDCIEKNRHQFSRNYARSAELRPGLYLEILDEKCHNTHCLENQHDIPFPLISKFYLSGNHCVLTPGIKDVKDDYVEKINQNYLFYLPDIKEIEQWQAGEYIHLVRIATDIDFLTKVSEKSPISASANWG
ncbi:MAG: hypothetical protein GVY17_03370 [Cyanobacteria bacterium]|jgi:hypothetical protein|nr:hypothetical protein [Cyanobacteria bacterium GSL.Bin21]